MRRTLQYLFIIGLFCFPLFAQTSDACRADLQHLTLPASAQINDGNGQTALEFLFTEDGDDIYSATSFDPRVSVSHFMDSSWGPNTGMIFIVVYQDESARQQTIQNLLRPNVTVTFAKGIHHAPLDNLKFATVHVKADPSFDDAFYRTKPSVKDIEYHELMTAKWYIADIQYFEPQSCETRTRQDLCIGKSGQMIPCILPGLHASDSDPNWITALNIDPNAKRLEPYSDPQYARIIKTMQGKLREFMAQKQRR